MDSGYYQKLRVLWHELGHFFANQYNQQHYQGEGTEELVIVRKDVGNQRFDYEGATKLRNYVREDVLRHPAAIIASSAYGPYLQCIIYGQELKSCLEARHTGAHGSADYEQINSAILAATGHLAAREPIFAALEQHFARIKQKPEFSQLSKVDIDDLVQSDADDFKVPLEELHHRFDFFFPLHDSYYRELVSTLETILKPWLR
ncbi:hypothetical protein GFS24_11215 [Chitinophaga sp. SYP-B3965]|uniref:hypothetical protein n=1 Tax=Chitinophaga sp. SYP-B3965 TaxID=2663120 RepID=UPI00129970B1|nr:hypothetical protein [Chitinophaga sp. SYP-B3965]MRG45688.1 hypothetical protein [Chitinophaga sp. SYP-B3965]